MNSAGGNDWRQQLNKPIVGPPGGFWFERPPLPGGTQWGASPVHQQPAPHPWSTPATSQTPPWNSTLSRDAAAPSVFVR
ncbi:hypothetical protein VTO42DRAFT_2466 [Malbranchea cinnamomea]